jgi:predicted Holliday junction resolvase-like endonuclease
MSSLDEKCFSDLIKEDMMKTILLSLSVLMLAIACDRRPTEVKQQERMEDARHKFQEEVYDANREKAEAVKDAQRDLREEEIDAREEIHEKVLDKEPSNMKRH